ncbi:MAG TPA: ABC transporter permease [Polyangiaceae bacterium]|nr:ABC transporter permease [Polyangiaceae bacterium]
MNHWIAAVIGLIAGGALLVLLGVLVLSLPLVGGRLLWVLARREWVPVSYNLRSLARRKTSTASTFVVLALVVFVLTAVMMLAQGIAHTLTSTAPPLNVKLMMRRGTVEWHSYIPFELMSRLSALPGIAPNAQGAPLISPELVVLIWAERGGADPDDGANLTVRGVHPIAFELHPLQIREGRSFETGKDEIIIGKALVGRFAGATLGGRMTFADHDWTVVGIADHGGTAHDSEIWGDIEVMAPTFKRGYCSATLRLSDRSELDGLAAALASNPDTSAYVARREVDYWRSLSEQSVNFVRLLGAAVVVVFSFGAILGALNTMYAQVTARTRELGTLRAIGFKPRAILVSLVLESVLLSLAAGVLGVLGASLLENVTFELSTVQTLSEITYGFHLSPRLALASLGFAVLLGYAGGLLPALRAARMPIVNAVRAD